MARREGWEHRFADLIVDAQTRIFAYGTWDCCRFAADAVKALMGTDPYAEEFCGQQPAEPECFAAIERAGGILSLAQRIATDCRFAKTRPVQAQRGDVVLGKRNELLTLGVCIGNRVVFAIAPKGLAAVSLTDPSLLRAWRIA
jgi:hypothetical protein